MISGIFNLWLSSSIQLHDALHGFRAGVGTGTATLEGDILQHLIAIREKVLYAIFLYLHKSYYALERESCLDILVGYRVGPRKIRILRMYWVRLQMLENAGGHCGPAFQIHHGVTQGDPL